MNNLQVSLPQTPITVKKLYSAEGVNKTPSSAVNFQGAAVAIKNSSVAQGLKKPAAYVLLAAGTAIASFFGIKTAKQKEADEIYSRITNALETQEKIIQISKKIPGLCDFANVNKKDFNNSVKDGKALSEYSRDSLGIMLSNKQNKQRIIQSLKNIEKVNSGIMQYSSNKNNTPFHEFAERINKIDMKKMDHGYVMAVFDFLHKERVAKIKEAEKQQLLSGLDNVDKEAVAKRQAEYKKMNAMKKFKLYQEIVPKIDWLEDKKVANQLKTMLFEEQKISIIEADEILKSYNVKPPKDNKTTSFDATYALYDMMEDKDEAEYLKFSSAMGQNVVEKEEIAEYKKGKKLRELFAEIFSSIDFSKKPDKKAQ